MARGLKKDVSGPDSRGEKPGRKPEVIRVVVEPRNLGGVPERFFFGMNGDCDALWISIWSYTILLSLSFCPPQSNLTNPLSLLREKSGDGNDA